MNLSLFKLTVLTVLGFLIIFFGWRKSVRNAYAGADIRLQNDLTRIQTCQEVRGELLEKLQKQLDGKIPEADPVFERCAVLSKKILQTKTFQMHMQFSLEMTAEIEKIMVLTKEPEKQGFPPVVADIRNKIMEIEQDLLSTQIRYNKAAVAFNRGLTNFPGGLFIKDRHYKPYSVYTPPEKDRKKQ